MRKDRKLEVVAAALAMLCMGCFFVSRLYYFGFGLGSYVVSCASGCVFVTKLPPPTSPHAFFQAEQSPFVWTASIVQLPPAGFMVVAPLWLPFVLFGGMAAFAHRRGKRVPDSKG